MHLTRVLPLLFLGACAVEDPQLAETSEELILGTENWKLLTSLETDAKYHIDALYGRATANLPQGRCTGWMITDNVLVTANHCRDGNTQQAVFGLYGPTAGSTTTGLADARARLRELGIPSSVAVPDATLTTFTCNLWDTEASSRDVDYYVCDPNRITANISPFNRARTFQILPGQIWGHYELALGMRSDDDDMHAISVNERNAEQGLGQSVLISPGGWIYDADDNWTGWDYEHNFEFFDADTVCGSSGGVVLDNNHRAYGLISGHYGTSSQCTRTIYSGNIAEWQYTNIGTYLGTKSRDFTKYLPAMDPIPQVGTHDSPWVGGQGGTFRATSCPSTHIAAGVIGTRHNGVLSNFGLICVPFRKNHNGGSDHETDRNFAHATVISGGSIDTGFKVATNADYNVYWHEVLPGATSSTLQAQLMCPYGSYLSGVAVRPQNALLAGVDHIRCTELRQINSTTIDARNGTRSSTALAGGTNPIQNSFCGANSYVFALQQRAGYFTDGFSLGCKQLYGTPIQTPGGPID